jgi:hypothetical protein
MPKSAKAETLRQRIALYRSYLRDGVNAGLAREYLKEIAKAEAALGALVESDGKSSGDNSNG